METDFARAARVSLFADISLNCCLCRIARRCSCCETVHDRGLRAEINLKDMALNSIVAACGEAGPRSSRKLE